MMTSCCLRAPKKHEAWLAWMSLQATTSSIRFVLLVAVIFAGSPLATKSHLHDSYFTLNTHPSISKNAEQARTGRGFLAKWVLCIVGSNLRRNFCPSWPCIASCKRTSCELLRYTEIQWHSCSACCKLLIHGIGVDMSVNKTRKWRTAPNFTVVASNVCKRDAESLSRVPYEISHW
jgi:hypothetical protein